MLNEEINQTMFLTDRNKQNHNIIEKIKTNKPDEICIQFSMYMTEDIKMIKELFLNITKLNKKPKILIEIYKICELNLLNFDKFHKMGLQFRISIDSYTYNYEEINAIYLKLQNYIINITNDSMTPYEKYISIYNFVRKYKKYKVIPQPKVGDLSQMINNKNQSSSLKYILENEYIDCRGFSYLLDTMLNIVGIESSEFSFNVYKPDGSILGGHSRTLINIDDDKYNLHGLYISDATWDSENQDNNLDYSLLPLSSMRSKIYSQCDVTLLFESKNKDEFESNINGFYNKNKRKNTKAKILTMICSVDKNKASELDKIQNEDEFFKQLMEYILLKNNH